VSYMVAAEVSCPVYPDRFVRGGAGKWGFSMGGEVSLIDKLHARGGFVKEGAYRGNIKMATIGAGFSVDIAEMPCRINASYQMPFGNANGTAGLKNNYSIGISTAVSDGH